MVLDCASGVLRVWVLCRSIVSETLAVYFGVRICGCCFLVGLFCFMLVIALFVGL